MFQGGVYSFIWRKMMINVDQRAHIKGPLVTLHSNGAILKDNDNICPVILCGSGHAPVRSDSNSSLSVPSDAGILT